MRAARASRVIVGDDEAAADTVAIKPLREGGDQISVPVRDLAGALRRRSTPRQG